MCYTYTDRVCNSFFVEGEAKMVSHENSASDYEKFKDTFCVRCQHSQESENCIYVALCFVSFVLNGGEPQYFTSFSSPEEDSPGCFGDV